MEEKKGGGGGRAGNQASDRSWQIMLMGVPLPSPIEYVLARENVGKRMLYIFGIGERRGESEREREEEGGGEQSRISKKCSTY